MPDSVQAHVNEHGIATLTLCKPAVGNAFDDTMIAAMVSMIEQWSAAADVRIIVLRSEGKHFSAGADLNWMKRMAALSEDENRRDASSLARLMNSLWLCPTPVIARVQGAAFGGAVGLAACADIVIAAEDARFCLSEVKVGLVPAVISPYVARAMGSRAASRYFLTAEVINAVEAHRLGLVHDLAPEVLLDDRLQYFCNTLLANSPAALREAKALIRHLHHTPIDTPLVSHTTDLIARVRVSAEGQEGLSAFLEKRSPAWINGRGNV